MSESLVVSTPTATTPFSFLSDDIVLNIFFKLESDPRDWARLVCVSTRFSVLILSICYPSRCSQTIPSVLSDLLPTSAIASLYKLSVCCPGLIHAGVLLENSDFGLEREIGPDQSYRIRPTSSSTSAAAAAAANTIGTSAGEGWSLFDDLYFDTEYDASEAQLPAPAPASTEEGQVRPGGDVRKRRKKWVGPVNSHLASGPWNLSREQGNKLLASRFRGDALYICDWPGCVHAEEKRKYMLFRGVFKDFRRSRVWRTIHDGNRVKIGLNCAFCDCRETWDLHSAFCLRRVFGFHDDGEPVVRAYVCENGHVSGAWTERPMYT